MALSIQTASTSLPSTESAPRWKHDVFLSFRGADTREGFVSHLYHELQYWQAIKTFKDDRELEVGASISLELLSAIEASHLAIVVLSPNYASSAWCLDELVKILESMETRDTILPIFFHVDACDVRYQRGSFAQAFAKHEERFSEDIEKLNRWRSALNKVASLSGWDSKNYECERELIKVIVKYVWSKVRPTITLSDSKDKLVGIDAGLVELGYLLAPEVSDVRFIGIWGMGGIGKTTLAKLVFERISHHFEVSKFLVNVREVSAKHGTLVDLQKQLLSPILKENIAQIWDEQDGTLFIRKCLFNKKVLLIVDNVDHYNQLKVLVGNKSWFGEGSRVIITTRNKHLLIEHDIKRSFKVEGLNASTALELFSHNAFGKDEPPEGFSELSKCFVDYAKGLPLALKIMGRSLYKRCQDEWISALDNLKNSPDTRIFSSLKISYDGLCEMSQRIFLDVAFFHKGKNKKKVIEILDKTCNFSSLFWINVLIEKSLLTIGKYNNVEMHDLIQEMAWEIVRRESREDPGLRSRLRHRKDIFDIFMKNTGTESIIGISLCLPKLEAVGSSWNCESFSKMLKLMVLEFDNLMINSAPKFLPNSLIILKWRWYPSKFLPASYRPNLLLELHMENSKLVQLWDGKLDLPYLKYMGLSNSKNLTKIPDVSGIPNLEMLHLRNCRDLVEIHPSIAVHKKLAHLELAGCKSLKTFPSEIEMDSLQLLGLSGCSKLRNIPEFGIHMKNLTHLELSGTVIEKIPSSMERLVGLEFLDMNRCTKLEKLPKFLGKMERMKELSISETAIREPPPPFLFLMKNLKELHFHGKSGKLNVGFWGFVGSESPEPLSFALPSLRALSSLESLKLTDHDLCEIPDDIGHCMSSLRFLNLSGNNFVTLPASIKFLSKLESFHVERCQRLKQLPELPSNHLLDVIADDCASLKLLPKPSKLLNLPSTKFAEFSFSSVNCYGLVDEEGWNNGILSIIRILATQGIPPVFQKFNIVTPGSQIPGWFSDQSEGDSLIVQLPQESCSRWMGIAFCVVTADLGNPAALGCEFLRMNCFWNGNCCNFSGFKVTGHFVRAHLWIFYMTHKEIRHTFSHYNYNKIWLTDMANVVFSFKASYGRFGKEKFLNVKKCGARLVCEQDLEELLRTTVNSLKRTRDEEGPSGSGSSNNVSLFKRLKGRLFS